MVVVHHRYDQAMKQLLRSVLEVSGTFEPEAEVSPDPQRADGYYIPDPSRSSPIASTLLGRMSRTACTFEVFSETPSDVESLACVRKHLNFRHVLDAKDPPVLLPFQWIISSGRPESAFQGLAPRRMRRFPTGVYGLPSLLSTAIVVVNELPEDRSTLLVRLMGRGRTLRRALAEFSALPPGEFEQYKVHPILLRFRIDTPSAPISAVDEEYLMATQDVVEQWERRTRNEGLQQGLSQGRDEGLRLGRDEGLRLGRDEGLRLGRDEGLRVGRDEGLRVGRDEGQRDLLLHMMHERFGNVSDDIMARVEKASPDKLRQLATKLFQANSIEELFADE